MPVQYTSRIGYLSILVDLSTLQKEVYQAIKMWPETQPGPSIEDLAKVTGRKESSVCGRISELKDSKAIVEGPMKLNSTEKPAKTYRALVYMEERPQYAQIFRKDGQGELFGTPPSDPLHN